jgi:hypothetical protein
LWASAKGLIASKIQSVKFFTMGLPIEI